MGNEQEVIGEGTVVRDRKWGGTCTGTVVRREGDSLFVAWHNSFVEDELTVSEVKEWPDARASACVAGGRLESGTRRAQTSQSSRYGNRKAPTSDTSSMRASGSGPRRIFSQASTCSVAELPRVSVNTASIVLAMAPEPRR